MTAAEERRRAIEQAQIARSVARSLTAQALGERLAVLALDVRTFGPIARQAYLQEAAARLRSGNLAANSTHEEVTR